MLGKPICLFAVALIGLPLLADPAQDSTPPVTTPLETYRCYTNSVIAPIWLREMEANESSLNYRQVKIRCTIHSDGTVTNLKVVAGDYSGLLKTISMKVLLKAAPFRPFSDALVKEIGKSYTDVFTFSVVRKAIRPEKDWAPGGEDHPASADPLD